MIKRVETSLLYGLNAIKNNTFKGEVITFDVKVDGVGYSTTNPAITKDIQSRVETVKEHIISGQIKVAGTNAEAKTLPGFPQDLKAVDD